MADFKDFFTNKSFIKAYVKKDSLDGVVYIENEVDRLFWEEFLLSGLAHRYDFKFGTIGNPSTRGKGVYNDMFAQANEAVLFAIDSDFDYLAENRSDVSKIINQNKYVIQTFAYATENIKFAIEPIDECLRKFRYCDDHGFYVSDFLMQYSKVIHEPLIKYLYLLDCRFKMDVDESIFHESIIPTKLEVEKCFFDSDWSLFLARVATFNYELDSLISDVGCFEGFKANTIAKGVSEENAYQFISGHDLEDKIVNVIIHGVKSRVIDMEIKRIRSDFPDAGPAFGQKVNEVRNHFKNCCLFKSLIHGASDKTKNPIYKKISAYVESLGL